MGQYYYLTSVMDGYSRKIIYSLLSESMEGINAEIVIARAKEARPEARARVIQTTEGSSYQESSRS